MKHVQWIPIIGCALIIFTAFALYGQTFPDYNYSMELLPFPTKIIEINPDNSTSFIGSMKNVGDRPCRAVLLSKDVSWNYTDYVIPINNTVIVLFTINHFNETMTIHIEGVSP